MNIDRNIPNCLNCNNPFSETDSYCSNCSQKRTNGIITVKDLFADFFSTLFNIDGKLINTIKDLFIPGKLTTSFFAGQHEKYYKPVRMFLFSLVTLFAILSLTLFNSKNLSGDKKVREIFTKIQHKNELKKEWEKHLGNSRQQFTEKKELIVIDSISTIIDRDLLPLKDSMSLFDEVDGFGEVLVFNFDLSSHKFATSDLHLFDTDFDKLAEKYEITNFMEKLGLQQSYKVSTDPIGTLKFVLGNMTWMLVVLIPVIAFLLQLLYFRKKLFFVQHLTFLFHNHAFVFLTLTLLAIITHFTGNKSLNNALIAGTLLGMHIFLFLSMKRYYSQGFFKTLFKYIIVFGSYLFISLLFFTITIFISFAMYS